MKSIVSFAVANAPGNVDVSVTKKEAERLIADHDLRRDEDDDDESIGSWSRQPDGRYFIHFET